MEEKNYTIKQTNNGFIVSWEEDWGEDGKKEALEVFEERFDEEDREKYGGIDDEKIALARALEFIAERFCGYGKSHEDNIAIRCDGKGHKLEE